MVVVGMDGLNHDESRTHFAMWAIWSSPLLMSNDLRSIKPEMKEILQNKEVIAVNQDKLGIFGKRVHKVILKHLIKYIILRFNKI
jgi:hypothetical protein